MKFAILDIETTGGSPNNEKITEIAIYVHDGPAATSRTRSPPTARPSRSSPTCRRRRSTWARRWPRRGSSAKPRRSSRRSTRTRSPTRRPTTTSASSSCGKAPSGRPPPSSSAPWRSTRSTPRPSTTSGVAWDARADTKKALDYFKKSTAADPTFAEAWFNQGMSFMKLNQQAQATRAFEQALKLEPGSLGALRAAGQPVPQAGQEGPRAGGVQEGDRRQRRRGEEAPAASCSCASSTTRRRTTDAYRGLALTLPGDGQGGRGRRGAEDRRGQDAEGRVGPAGAGRGVHGAEQLRRRDRPADRAPARWSPAPRPGSISPAPTPASGWPSRPSRSTAT